jgi:putative thiamine transport system permease protein
MGVVRFGLILPILAGLAQTGQAAFGIFPALGHDTPSLAPWHMLAALPGAATSLRPTIVTGIGSTLVSLVLATTFCAAVHSRLTPDKGARWLAPFLAAPHAAMAIGIAFVLAPSGWIARAVAAAAGWDRPPDLATVNDGAGLALGIGLIVKEMPFLLLVILSALSQIDVRRHLAVARSLGYGRGVAWIKVIMPLVWPLIRLPVYVVLAYALSTVDMAIILGSSNPPTLSVAVARWYSDPDPAMFLPASAGAILQGTIVVAAILVFWLAEALFSQIGGWWLRRGGRGVSAEPGLRIGAGLAACLMLAGALAMSSLLVWSVAWRWPFPDVVPQSWSLRAWLSPQVGWGKALANTLILALMTTALSLTLAIAWLEGEDRAQYARALGRGSHLSSPSGTADRISLRLARHLSAYGRHDRADRRHLGPVPFCLSICDDCPVRSVAGARSTSDSHCGRAWRRPCPQAFRGQASDAASTHSDRSCGGRGCLRRAISANPLSRCRPGGDADDRGGDAVIVFRSARHRCLCTLQAVLPFATYALAFLIPAILYRNRRDLQGKAGA